MADATASNGAPGADAEPQLTAAGIGSLSAQELVTELAKRGAPTSGNDGELVSAVLPLRAMLVRGGVCCGVRCGPEGAVRAARSGGLAACIALGPLAGLPPPQPYASRRGAVQRAPSIAIDSCH